MVMWARAGIFEILYVVKNYEFIRYSVDEDDLRIVETRVPN